MSQTITKIEDDILQFYIYILNVTALGDDFLLIFFFNIFFNDFSTILNLYYRKGPDPPINYKLSSIVFLFWLYRPMCCKCSFQHHRITTAETSYNIYRKCIASSNLKFNSINNDEILLWDGIVLSHKLVNKYVTVN